MNTLWAPICLPAPLEACTSSKYLTSTYYLLDIQYVKFESSGLHCKQMPMSPYWLPGSYYIGAQATCQMPQITRAAWQVPLSACPVRGGGWHLGEQHHLLRGHQLGLPDRDGDLARGKHTMSKKSNTNFRDVTRKVEENEILHKIFLVVSRFHRYISCYISENGMGTMYESFIF